MDHQQHQQHQSSQYNQQPLTCSCTQLPVQSAAGRRLFCPSRRIIVCRGDAIHTYGCFFVIGLASTSHATLSATADRSNTFHDPRRFEASLTPCMQSCVWAASSVSWPQQSSHASRCGGVPGHSTRANIGTSTSLFDFQIGSIWGQTLKRPFWLLPLKPKSHIQTSSTRISSCCA